MSSAAPLVYRAEAQFIIRDQYRDFWSHRARFVLGEEHKHQSFLTHKQKRYIVSSRIALESKLRFVGKSIALSAIMTATPLQVAIIGAGIAGLTAALSLRQALPDQPIRITIYEKAAELREIGASIGLNPSGLRILEKLGVNATLDGSISYRQRGEWPMIYRHWLTNEELGHDEYREEVEERHRMGRFHRAHLQAALVQAVRDAGGVEIHFGARIKGVEVEREGGPAVISFENGQEVKADLILGTDGIHSRVRQAFASHHELKWTGQVAFRSAFDVSLVENIHDLPDDAIFWVGHERTLFASRLGMRYSRSIAARAGRLATLTRATPGKNQYTVVGSYIADPNDPNTPFHNAKWSGPGDLEFLRSLYKVRLMLPAN